MTEEEFSAVLAEASSADFSSPEGQASLKELIGAIAKVSDDPFLGKYRADINMCFARFRGFVEGSLAAHEDQLTKQQTLTLIAIDDAKALLGKK